MHTEVSLCKDRPACAHRGQHAWRPALHIITPVHCISTILFKSEQGATENGTFSYYLLSAFQFELGRQSLTL